MTNEAPVIEMADVGFSYDGEPVLKDVTFSVAPREFLAIIGPNGGGKSTLVKLMLGLLKPDTGRVRLFGKPPRKMAHRIGYVPQDVSINKSFPISLIDVVLMGRLRHHGRSRVGKSDRERASEMLHMLGLGGLENRKIDNLSGGQRERAFIARALMTDPEVLILDEPTTSVDTGGQAELYSLLRDLNETKTIIVVSHDLMVLSSYVKSVACVNQQVHYHDQGEIPEGMIQNGYQCPVELIAHGQPHRILKPHEDV